MVSPPFHPIDAEFLPCQITGRVGDGVAPSPTTPPDMRPRIRRLPAKWGSAANLTVVHSTGAGGSGLSPNQRRSRNARSLSAWLPKSAVAMIVSTTTTSMTAMTSPSMG